MLKPRNRLRGLLGFALLATPVWPVCMMISEGLHADGWLDIWGEMVRFFGHPLPAIMLLTMAIGAPLLGAWLLLSSFRASDRKIPPLTSCTF